MRTLFFLLIFIVACSERKKVKLQQNNEQDTVMVSVRDTLELNSQNKDIATVISSKPDTMRGAEHRYAASAPSVDNKTYYPNFTVHTLTDSVLSLDQVKVLVKPDYLNAKKWIYPFKNVEAAKVNNIVIKTIVESSRNHQSLGGQFNLSSIGAESDGYVTYSIRQRGDFLVCQLSFIPLNDSNKKKSLSHILIFDKNGELVFDKFLNGPLWQGSITDNGNYVMANSKGFVSESVKTPFCSIIYDLRADTILWQKESVKDYISASGGMGSFYSKISIIKDNNYNAYGMQEYVFDSRTGKVYEPILKRLRHKIKIRNNVLFHRIKGKRQILDIESDFRLVDINDLL